MRWMPRNRTWTDDDLKAAVASSENLNQVCMALGIKPGSRTYALLRRHIARLGIDAGHLPPVERAQRRRSWSDDDLRDAVANNATMSGVLRTLGYEPNAGMHRYIRKAITHHKLDTSHFRGKGWAKGHRRPGWNSRPLSQILVARSDYKSTSDLRKRLIVAGLKTKRCERCGLDSWLGAPLPLTLDHVNGDHTDNRLENLRILCPNCHALTPTWCRRNGSKPA